MKALTALLLLSLCGCGWGDDSGGTPRPRGVVGRAVAPQQQEQAARAEKAPGPQPVQLPEPQPAPAAAPEPEQQEEPERDYAAELRTAFGSPLGCLKERRGDDVPNEITIHLSATVMAGGNISRGYVRSGELDEEELACLDRQLEARRLPGEVEDAPRGVDATITLQLKQPEKSGE